MGLLRKGLALECILLTLASCGGEPCSSAFEKWWSPGKCGDQDADAPSGTDGHEGLGVEDFPVCLTLGVGLGLDLVEASGRSPVLWTQAVAPATVPFMTGHLSEAGVFDGWEWAPGSVAGPAVLRTFEASLTLMDLPTAADVWWTHTDGSSPGATLSQGEKTNQIGDVVLPDGSTIAWAFVPGQGTLYFTTGADVRGFAREDPPVGHAGPSPSNTKSTSSRGLHFRPTMGRCVVRPDGADDGGAP